MSENNENQIELARELLAALESGDNTVADAKLESLAEMRDSDLFNKVGEMTRHIHSSLNDFLSGNNFIGMAEDEIPDAKDRLHYVIRLTEEATHKTIDEIEQISSVLSSLKNSVDEALVSNNVESITSMSEQIETVQDKLREILLTQSFQDLTGQIIRRVISLVQDVEDSMIDLVKVFGGKYIEARAPVEKPQERLPLEGPQLPNSTDVVEGQDEVDDLLSKLGF